jgi:hypothetical protein
LDISEILNAAECTAKYKAIDAEKPILILNRREYGPLYARLEYMDTAHYIDDNDEENFLIKFDYFGDIENIIRYKVDMNLYWRYREVILKLNVENTNISGEFVFDLDDAGHLYEIKKIIENNKIYLHFVHGSRKEIIKSISILMNIDGLIMEKFIYTVSLAYSGSYPVIQPEENNEDKGCFIDVENREGVLEDLIDIADELGKWSSSDDFKIYLDNSRGLRVVFTGSCSNLNYIKSELVKKHAFTGEGEGAPLGRPFLKYDRGMLYFYEKPII